ncbi:hypothetical protein BC829DRAFT_447700 [Chytridium lagenaria]|nr:hypothetical protein BC829DRAFT_447700 [Chytridium lagenaria]
MTTLAKMAAKTGIPENARLFQIKAGRDLPSIKERSNGIISEFRATCAIFQVPICQENLTRFIRNQNKGKTELSDPYLDASECEIRGLMVLDPRATAGQHQKRGPSGQDDRRCLLWLSAPGGVSKDEDHLSHLASSSASSLPSLYSRVFTRRPMDEDDEVVRVFSDGEHTSNLRKLRAGFEPASSEHMTNKGKEPLPIIAWGSSRPSHPPACRGAPLIPASSSLGARRVPPAPLTPPACFNPADDAEHGRSRSNSDPKTERTLGSNRYNIDWSSISFSAWRPRDQSLTSLVDERRKRLYKTINGVRDMLVDSTNELAMLMGCGAFNIRQLNAETDYTDAALVLQMKVKEMRDRLTSRRHPSSPLHLLRSLWSLQYRSPGSAETEKSGPSSPEPSPHNVGKEQLPLTSLSSVDGDSLTDTTTSSVGSASDDDDHTGPPSGGSSCSCSRRKAPRHPLSRPRVYGLANTKHLTSDVEGITKKLTLLQYRELRSGSSTPSSRPPLPFSGV